MLAPGTATGSPASAGTADSPADTGSRMQKVVPCPFSLSISIEPWCRSTMPYTAESPSPVPRSPLVVKNGSRQRRRVSSSMPAPVSVMHSFASPSSSAERIVMHPPSGIASTALKMRLVSISRSSAGSPSRGGSSPDSVRTSISRPRLRAWSCHLGRVSVTACSTSLVDAQHHARFLPLVRAGGTRAGGARSGRHPGRRW